jgi:trimeric autotransporter adhesin
MVYDPICDPLLRLEPSRFSDMATTGEKTDKKLRLALVVSLCLSFLSACGGGSLGPGIGKSTVTLQSIQISPSTASISLGQNQQFTATGHYSDGSSKDITNSVTWASSNTGVATISGSGLATSHSIGSATISAVSGNIFATATLTVTATKVVLVSIAVTPAGADLLVGTLQQFTATGTFSDGSQQDITSSVTWSSSNNSVVSIPAGGLATAHALGSVTISATLGSVSGSTTANVVSAELSSITVRPANKKIAKLTNQPFSAIGTYTDGSTHNITGQVAWTSSNTAVATIGLHGLAKALTPGTTTITATLDSISGSTTLDVTNATVVSITVTPSGRTIAAETRLAFTAVGLFSDNTRQVITRDSMWASDNHAVATVTGAGTATAIGPGTANISATFEGVTGSAPLIVSSATLSSISVRPATALLAPTTSVQCVAIGTFSDGSTQVMTGIVTWTSSASEVASVRGGRVTALSGGNAIITAQLGALQGDSTIEVDASPLTSIQITPRTATIPQQTTVAFVAIGTFADGKTQDLTTEVLWTASPASVASISDLAATMGRATGLEPGTATITALFDGQVGTATLTVTGAIQSAEQLPDTPHE